jgi:hypothetical protein
MRPHSADEKVQGIIHYSIWRAVVRQQNIDNQILRSPIAFIPLNKLVHTLVSANFV